MGLRWAVQRTRMRLIVLAAFVAVATALAITAPTASAHAAAARAAVSGHDTPAGFWYGTDSSQITIPGPAPYREPVIGGSYGGYLGMTGNWANLTGCHKIVVWSAANSKQVIPALHLISHPSRLMHCVSRS